MVSSISFVTSDAIGVHWLYSYWLCFLIFHWWFELALLISMQSPNAVSRTLVVGLTFHFLTIIFRFFWWNLLPCQLFVINNIVLYLPIRLGFLNYVVISHFLLLFWLLPTNVLYIDYIHIDYVSSYSIDYLNLHYSLVCKVQTWWFVH